MATALYFILIIVLVLANGFFVASEFALVGVRRSRILTLAKNGSQPARLLLGMIDNLNAYISATQLGITMASLAFGWIAEPVVAQLLSKPLAGLVSETALRAISFAVAFTAITFFHIVLGELAPKTLALERAEKVALAIAVPMRLFYKLFSWPIRLLDWAGRLTVRLFGFRPTGRHSSVYTEEELRHLIDISRQGGQVKEVEQRLIHRVFDFADAEVKEAMVPRVNVIALPVSATLEEAKKIFRTHGYTRLPVYRENLDDVFGVVVRRDLEPYLEKNSPGDFNLEKLIYPPIFIPTTAKLGTALKQMQAKRAHLAFVIDEHGGLAGIVTLEDLLEEIVGEINDEYDEEIASQIVRVEGGYLIDGMLAVRDANRKLGLKLPEDESYTTIAGFLTSQAGHLLRSGEVVEYDGASFTVDQVEKRQIRRVRFSFTNRLH
ncbi:MAG: HlyC/CorC family transporter [Blastocatellia bacterium]|nr:HlyC/CorC family transporter [Blastocatellia bacterium]